MRDILFNALNYGAIGCVLFFIILVIISRTKIFEAVRDEEGQFRKGISPKGIFGLSLMLGFFVGIIWWSTAGFAQTIEQPDFYLLWWNAFLTFMVIHLFDLVVIDLMLIVWWHPKFLNLPETDYYTKSAPHIKGFIKGIPLGAVLSMVISLLYLAI